MTLGGLRATLVSARLGWVDDAHFDELRAWLRPFFSPYHEMLPRADSTALLGAMKLDKKNVGGRINCILTRGPGRTQRTTVPSGADTSGHPADFVGPVP